MSVNAAFSIFKPNPLYRNLRDERHNDDVSISSLDYLDGKLSVLSEDVDDLDDVVIRDVDDDLGLLADQVRDLSVEKATLEAKLSELEQLTSELQREKAELRRQNAVDSELGDLVARLSQEKAELQQEVATLRRRVDQQRLDDEQALDEARVQQNELTNLVTELTAQKSALLEEAHVRQSELSNLVAELTAQKTNLIEEARIRQSELTDLVDELTAQKADLQQLNHDLEMRVEETGKAGGDSSMDEEVVAFINELTSERDRLLKLNETVERQKDELQRRHDELQAQPRVDEELATLVSGMATKNEDLKKQNEELQAEVDEVYELMEQMNEHIESLEIHQHSLVAYVNKVCNDVKNVKRRGVWQKIEYDKERQLLVEELYSWKRRAEELKASEKDAVAAAEATAAWEAACLNQTIEQLQGEILTIKTELDEAKEELSRRGGSEEEAAETEQMLEAVQELALDLKTQVDEANAALEQQKAAAVSEIDGLQELVRGMKQRAVKDALVHDKERQELMEEVLMWKNRALETSGSASDTTQSEPESVGMNPISEDEQTIPAVEDTVEDSTQCQSSPSLVDNQTEDQNTAYGGVTKGDNQVEETPRSALSDSFHQTASPVNDSIGNRGNQREQLTETDAEKSAEIKSKPPVGTSLRELEEEDDKDRVSDSPLLTPPHSDSFFSRLRSFSFRSRTDSMTSSHGPENETPNPTRSRANSTTSSTTSATSSTKRVKAKAAPSPPPVTQYTRSDFMRQQEPLRMNSFKHFL